MEAVDFIVANWEWFLLGFMVAEKMVKLSPTDADDILLDVVWNSVKKMAGKGKQMLKKLVRRLVKRHGMKGLLIKIRQWHEAQSPGENDDEIWETVVKPFIEDSF